ncbi:MAG TPA: S9 family peptidase [Rhodanobacteraceae bacterium]|nr:S9 family peptidase [Rhodanobacteraceae bacterium]
MMRDRLLALSLLAFASAASAAEIPLEDFARHAQFRDIKISPDGDYIAASAVVDGKAVLSLVKLDDMKGVNLKPRESGEVYEFWWVAPHRVVYNVAERVSTLETPSLTGELYGVNADGTRKQLLLGYRQNHEAVYADVVRPLWAEGGKVLISKSHWNGSADGAFPTAAYMDVNNGTLTEVGSAPIKNAVFIADHQGQVRFATADSTDQGRRVYYRASNDANWNLVFDESRDDPVVRPLGFARDDRIAYFACPGTHGAGGLCRWNAETKKSETLWSGGEAGIDELVPTFDRKDFVALRSMPGRIATTLIDKTAPESKLLTGLMQQFPGEDVRLTSSTADGSKVVFHVSSDRNPGEFYLFDRAAGKATFLFASRPWIKADEMGAMEPISLKARDGLPLHGYLTRPHGKEEAKNLPMVVVVHGGPYGIRDAWEFSPDVQMLASRGYAVLQVNFRGSGGYGDKFLHAGFREWGAKMQDDVTDATRWAIADGIADPKRICIFGASYGGYAALRGVTREPDLYRCAVGYVGVYDLRLMYTRGDIPQSTYGSNYLKMVLGEDESVLWDRSPIAHLDQLKAKVMLIVGGEDTRVPPVQGENLHNALDKTHVAHEWLYQRTEGHGFYDEKNIADLLTRVNAFLDRNIGNAASSGAAP